MNSSSKLNNNEKDSIYDKYQDCDKNCIHPTPGKVLLKCTNGNIPIVNINLVGPIFTQTFNQPIASVTIDTACLCNPKLLIDFIGIITATPNPSIILTSTFTLFKTCKESTIRQPVATYDFNVISLSGLFPNSQTIKFEYSPCDDQCEDCRTYTLEFTRVSSSLFGNSGSISINGTLCVLAVDSSS